MTNTRHLTQAISHLRALEYEAISHLRALEYDADRIRESIRLAIHNHATFIVPNAAKNQPRTLKQLRQLARELADALDRFGNNDTERTFFGDRE